MQERRLILSPCFEVTFDKVVQVMWGSVLSNKGGLSPVILPDKKLSSGSSPRALVQ